MKTKKIFFYQLKRENGEIAETSLSEGEETFITFLYFLQRAKGGITEEEVNEDRVLVVDDPISSLDSNVLFIVSSLIKEIIRDIKKDKGNIKQILLFTHNIYFHKEASFIDGRTKKNNQTHFWILRKHGNVSSIIEYKQDNPIRSSYELLWHEIKNEDCANEITMPNTMRRIVEYYFKFLGTYKDTDLIDKFDNHEEKQICSSLISWVNDGSHCLPEDLFVQAQGATISLYKIVFKKVFDQTGHIEHYNMMMGISN